MWKYRGLQEPKLLSSWSLDTNGVGGWGTDNKYKICQEAKCAPEKKQGKEMGGVQLLESQRVLRHIKIFIQSSRQLALIGIGTKETS